MVLSISMALGSSSGGAGCVTFFGEDFGVAFGDLVCAWTVVMNKIDRQRNAELADLLRIMVISNERVYSRARKI
jgi:hypothetical protein